MNLSEAIDLYLKDKYVKGCTEKTIQHYKEFLYYFLKFTNDIDIKFLDYDVYSNFVVYCRNKKLSKNTLNTYTADLKNFYKFLSIDCISKIKVIRRSNKIINILNDEEIKILLNSFGFDSNMNLQVVLLMLNCGLRSIEIRRLKWTDIDFSKNVIIVYGKNDKYRLIPFSNSVKYFLLKYKNDKIFNHYNYVFSYDGSMWNEYEIKSIFKMLKVTTGIKRLHAHLLRHTFATKYLLNDGQVTDLQYLLGHSEIGTTMKYVHLANQIKLKDKIEHFPLSNIKGE